MNDIFKERDKEVQKKKWKKFLKNANKIVKLIGAIGTSFSVVTGVSLCTAIHMVSKDFSSDLSKEKNSLWIFAQPCIDFIINNFAVILFILFVIGWIFNLKVIPKYKIEKEDVPAMEVKPSIGSIVLLIIGIISSLIVGARCNMYAKELPLDESDPEIVVDEIEDVPVLNDDGLTDEQRKIDDYIQRCVTEVISIDELCSLSGTELYYIRNGIYAYEGYNFDSGYYNIFSWYNGYILPEDFKESMLNRCQTMNILNIKKIEKQRNDENQ